MKKIDVLLTRVEGYQCTLSLISPVTFNHHVRGGARGRGGGGRGSWSGMEGDDQSRGREDGLVLLLRKH